MMASKIAVVGDVNGEFEQVFDKLGKLHAKHAFAFALIAGNLFRDSTTATDADNAQIDKLINGDISVPFPTYFSLGTRPLPASVLQKLAQDEGEVVENLYVLGRKVSVKTSSGFRLVAIGGKHAEAPDQTMDEYTPNYTDKDVQAAKDFKDADILVTNEWPAEICDGSKARYHGSPPSGVGKLGELCTALRPRYHFSTSASYFEREPFFHNDPAPQPVTRFLSLAPYGNSEKQKWVYAFSLEPSASPPAQLPDGVTASPFTVAKKRKLNSQQDSFRFATGNNAHDGERNHKRARGGRGGRRDKAQHTTPQDCYFCLSNRNAETHMIGSIGNDSYLTIAKGPLSKADTFSRLSSLDIPCHMLIIPLQHAATTRAFDEEVRESTAAEMQRYREALHTMVSSKSTSGDDGEAKLGAVTWEISRGGGVHLHWQFLPVPVDMIKRGLIEAAFDVEAENHQYPNFVKSAPEVTSAQEGHYFKAMIWSESIQKDIVLPLDETFRFDFQFGRKVLGKLLNLEERSFWKDVVQSTAEEEKDAEAFKTAFKDFDFSLAE